MRRTQSAKSAAKAATAFSVGSSVRRACASNLPPGVGHEHLRPRHRQRAVELQRLPHGELGADGAADALAGTDFVL
jgi:hypothetical protein